MLEKIIEALKTADDVETLNNAKEINIKVIDGNSIEIEAEFCDEEKAVQKTDCECENHCQDCECETKNVTRTDVIEKITELVVMMQELERSEGIGTIELRTLNDAVFEGSMLTNLDFYVQILRR